MMMFSKLLAVVIFVAAVGCVLLSFREDRLALMHQMAAVHAKMNHTRKQTWDLQTRIAEQAEPEALRKKLTEAGLKMTSVPIPRRPLIEATRSWTPMAPAGR